MPIAEIRCGFPYARHQEEEQTKPSLYIRIAAAITAALMLLTGALMISGIINLSSIGAVTGWSLIGVGSLILALTGGLQCVQKKTVTSEHDAHTPLEKDSIPKQEAPEQPKKNTAQSQGTELNKTSIRDLDPREYKSVKVAELPAHVQKEYYEALKGDVDKVRRLFHFNESILIKMIDDEKEIAQLLSYDLDGIYKRTATMPNVQIKYVKSVLKYSNAIPGFSPKEHFVNAATLLRMAKRLENHTDRTNEFKKIFDLLFEINFDLAGFFKNYSSLFANEDISNREIPLFYTRKLLQEGLGATLFWDMVGPNEFLLKNISADLTTAEKETLKNWLLALPASINTKIQYDDLK